MRRSVYLILAVVLFVSCGRGEQMRLQLERLEQDNRNDSVMQNDSLAESLVDYFDHHGTANERMRANYILGRTYFDLGELPRALETYYKAIDCADTISTDCDFKTLSRVHAQTAEVFRRQVQLRSELKEFKKAMYYAKKANDSLMELECYSKQAAIYKLLHRPDSVVMFVENASKRFLQLNQPMRSAQILGVGITSLIDLGNYRKAKQYINTYEASSGFFDERGRIRKGREIYYYIKGEFYLAINKPDSAEMLFRRLLAPHLQINCHIAGNKGLQKVYTIKECPDSIAKYANLSYELNDSAYSLSEMENIQKLQASYNYNYNKLLAEQQKHKADKAVKIIIIMILLVVGGILVSLYVFTIYRKKKQIQLLNYQRDLTNLERVQAELIELHSEESLISEEIIAEKNKEIAELQNHIIEYQNRKERHIATLEDRLLESEIVRHLHSLADANPYQHAVHSDFRKLRDLINEEIPHFYTKVNTSTYTLSAVEYDVTLLLRVHFNPAEIHKLTNLSSSYISNMRSRLHLKVYGKEGSPKDYDQKILSIK